MRNSLYLFSVCCFLVATLPAHAKKSPTFHLPEKAFSLTEAPTQTPKGLFGLLFNSQKFSRSRVKIDERMSDAIRIAEKSARSRSIKRCWRYVKRALQLANVIDCYPQTRLAKQAAVELPERYGFQQIPVQDPFDAPVGSVLVYGGSGAGHVEIRTEKGFVSDFSSREPSPRPLIGVFVKPPSQNTL